MCIGAMQALLDEEDIPFIAAVNGHEKLKEVAIGNDESRRKHDLGHVFEVAHGDEVLEAVGFAKGNGDGDDHGKTRVDGTGDEVRRENCGVPARDDSNREVETHDSMNGEHKRRSKPGKQQVGRLIAMPVASGTTPAHCEHAVNDLLGLALGTVAKSG